MSYLSLFPFVEYEHPNFSNETMLIRDLRVTIILVERINDRYKDVYTLTDGERPEDVSYNLYRTPNQYWILLALNEVIDPFYDWLLPEEKVVELAKKYYTDVNAIHHREDDDGEWDLNGITPVTNLEYELNLNEEKRRITVLKPEYLQRVITTLEKELSKREEDGIR